MADRDGFVSDLKQLLARVRHCTQCASDLPFPPRPVLAASTRSRILIAGQAPGRRVQMSGVPFDDPSGDRLRDWLGVDRNAFYNADKFAILPMGFCYPGTGKSGDLPPRPECAPLWRQQLLDALASVELTLVIGQFAQVWHLPERGKTLTETVRNWQSYWPQCLPLPHPSPRNNRWLKQNPWFVEDVLPALRARVRRILNPEETEVR